MESNNHAPAVFNAQWHCSSMLNHVHVYHIMSVLLTYVRGRPSKRHTGHAPKAKSPKSVWSMGLEELFACFYCITGNVLFCWILKSSNLVERNVLNVLFCWILIKSGGEKELLARGRRSNYDAPIKAEQEFQLSRKKFQLSQKKRNFTPFPNPTFTSNASFLCSSLQIGLFANCTFSFYPFV